MINDIIIRFASLLVGCVYPAFASYKILNSDRASGRREQGIWLTYWIVYGVYAFVEFLTLGLTWWLPFVNELKLFFLCWLLPTVGTGSAQIYDDFLGPFFVRNEQAIDQLATSVSSKCGELLRELVQMLYRVLILIVAEHCCLLRHNVDMDMTPSAETVINQMMAECPDEALPVASHDECQSLGEKMQTIEPSTSTATSLGVQDQPESTKKLSSEMELRIWLAEAVTAQRLQLCSQFASMEHLVCLKSCDQLDTEKPQRPPKPKRGVRKQPEADGGCDQQ